MEGLQNKKSQLIGIGTMAILMTATIIYVLRDEPIKNVFKSIDTVNPIYIITGILMMVFYVLCEGFNIWITMRALDKETNLIDCFKYGFVGFYFSSITPSASGGQPAQVYFMKRNGISITSSSLGLMILLFAHQLVVVFYGMIALIFRPDFTVTHKAGFHILIAYGIISNAAILIGIFLLILYPKIVSQIINIFGEVLMKIRIIKNKEKWSHRVSRSIDEYSLGAEYMKNNPRVLCYVVLVTFVQVTVMFLIPYVIYIGFGLGKFGPMDLILTQAILNIAVSSLPLPGAVGASESVFVDIFRTFFGSLVIPGMLLTRLANFYIVLVLSGVVSLYAYIKK